MNPAIFQIILAGLNAAPGLFAAASAIRADLSTTDQASLDQAIETAKASALAHVDQAVNDLRAAGQS